GKRKPRQSIIFVTLRRVTSKKVLRRMFVLDALDEMKQKPLFDKNATDDIETQNIVGGSSTGILNLNNVKYKWAPKLFREMLGNFWVPEKVNLQEDKITVKHLTDAEDKSLRSTLSFLIYLDSLQVNNLPNIQSYITDSAVSNLIGVQQFQEIIHSASYQYILESLYPSYERDEIYNLWRNNPLLEERNSFIAEQYQE